MTIGDRIKNRREELGMTQDELAKKLGYTSRSTIAKIEKEANNLRQSKIKDIADALETTPDYIMGWSQTDYVVNHNGQEFTIEVSKIVDAVDKSNPIMMNEETEKRLLSYADLFCKLNSDQQESIINLMKSMKK